ncbi:MAG TPA: L-seryl-tRNA(Sec) selenium transferase, partial [Planococcus sp. (in: firmicutes)]|nr:L-seryl-tRNA(Sec) selenium transferase [Planococcus sp. (in: firmicutes)]
MKQYLRQLPPVHELQRDERFGNILQDTGLTEEQVTEFVRVEVNLLRQLLQNGEARLELPNPDLAGLVLENAAERARQWQEGRIVSVINGTGTVLHTNLGRSRLSEGAIERVVEVARNYSNLEYRISEGKRGSRHDILEDLLKEATGAEAAMIVNNNAAAVFLVLSALTKNKEVIVSRGELVEIGGSFRVSSIMEESGACLKEVGTTNKTHLYDFEEAITEETAMIMKVHTSNFKIIGFTESVKTKSLVELADHHEGLLFYEDLGSGALYDFKQQGIGEEPLVKEVIGSGADIVSFSGDKLLGGPQAGIIAGKKHVIDRLKKHQLARVLRVDKMTLAALEATLKTYLSGGEAVRQLPTIRDITRPLEEIKQEAVRFISALEGKKKGYNLNLVTGVSQIGGGTMPGVELPTYVAAITHP